MSDDAAAELLAEQLRHTIDLLRADHAALRADLAHANELANRRLASLEAQSADYEQRLRSLQDSAVQYKLMASLATGGGLLSIISLIRTLLYP